MASICPKCKEEIRESTWQIQHCIEYINDLKKDYYQFMKGLRETGEHYSENYKKQQSIACNSKDSEKITKALAEMDRLTDNYMSMERAFEYQFRKLEEKIEPENAKLSRLLDENRVLLANCQGCFA